MKTTVEISDPLFVRAKEHCAHHGISFRELVEKGIRISLDGPKLNQGFRLKPFGFGGEGAVTSDWETIREMIYEGRGGESRER
jgi:hypothetical protein